MTNEEILQAQKLVASMREDLSLIAGTTDDADKLAALIMEKFQSLYDRFSQLGRWGRATFGSDSDFDSVNYGLATFLALAQMVQRSPDGVDPDTNESHKAALVRRVGVRAPLVDATLDKTAQALKTAAGSKAR